PHAPCANTSRPIITICIKSAAVLPPDAHGRRRVKWSDHFECSRRYGGVKWISANGRLQPAIRRRLGRALLFGPRLAAQIVDLLQKTFDLAFQLAQLPCLRLVSAGRRGSLRRLEASKAALGLLEMNE